MRKIILLIILLAQLGYNSFSQEGIHFKVQYKPETSYNQTITQKSDTYLKYSGSRKFLRKLKHRGIQNPTITNASSGMESVIKTGKLTDSINFPLTIEFLKSTRSDGKIYIPDGTLMYGHATHENLPKLDSIVSNELDEEFKETVLKSMQSIFSQITLPEKDIKVGEEFSNETPLSIPIGGITIDMRITTRYRLVSILNGMGNFDISQDCTFLSTIEDHTLNATGNGTGKLIYDISNNYYLNYQTDLAMEMNMEIENFSFYLKINSGIIQSTAITKNQGP